MIRPSPRRLALAVLALAVALVAVPSAVIELQARSAIVSLDAARPAPVAMVFGAGLAPGGEASPLLAERLETAHALLRAGKVQRLLLTGNTGAHHDEVRAMRRYLLAAGVPESALLLDLEGASTFESCWRARSVFGVSQALLVTQRFHLPRALFLAAHAGLRAEGVAAGGRPRWTAPYVWRELLARPLAVLDVLTHSAPVPPASPAQPG
ncbi:MAG TPA: ElyC/SanA/YdcF family protein [Myxococcaceae bacterium]|nr:ElyC/SanA/YdcF family protein [Myxococcaceae bacterium]